MIRCLLVEVTRNRKGQPIRIERAITADSLRVGRGTDCAIHLPDHRVALRHAVIRDANEGGHYLEAEAGGGVVVDGVLRHGADLTPGTMIAIGPYRFEVEAPVDGVDLVLAVELLHRRPREKAILERAPATLGELGLSKRRPMFWMATLIVVAALFLPLLQALSPAVKQAAAGLPFTPLQAWNPGPLLSGHQAFAAECEKCHQRPFGPVANPVCAGCHQAVVPHASPLLATTMRCVECHRDHKGGKGLVRGDRPLCVGCHEALVGSTGSSSAGVSGFVDGHPEFRVSFATRPEQSRSRRIAQSDRGRLVEDSGLNFSHKAHSGRLRVPSDPQTMRSMSCADCHQEDRGGQRFRPVTMKDHCFDCHKEKLDFDPPQDAYRLPHGPERAVMDVLAQQYLERALREDGLPHRGRVAFASAAQVAAAVAGRAERAASALVGDMGCGFCHEIERIADSATWKVRPVRITDNWLPAAHFAHDRHRTFACTDCHDLGRSERSSDVAIPEIAKCRECHAGEAPARGKVTSSCVACHRFHQPALALSRAAALAKGNR
jgi:predicted CXXCH cytochrome family protein